RNPGRPVGMKDLAEALGVSIGTVDRALHNKPGINPETRKKVLRIAKILGYRPNMAARYLSSRKSITLGVSIPLEIAYFYDDVRDGIFEAASAFEPLGVRLLYRPFMVLGQEEAEAFDDLLREEIQGVVISPGYPELLKPRIEKAIRRGIPVVCVATDAPGTERLTSISVDPLANGSIAGELMGRFLPPRSRVIVVTGMQATADHAQKVTGFRQSFRQFCPQGEIANVIEAHDEEAEAYEKCCHLLRKNPQIAGIYISTANSLPVIRALEDLGLAAKIKVIGTDFFPAMVPLIESGKIAATIYQRPREQGRIAFQTIYRFLTEGLRPPSRIGLDPAIIMRSNLKFFLIKSGHRDGGV
ncbi:MAG TPA: LacI family DNA-binding transcriptional regulator, partial [Terriglobia bacterium]|nr:LacI family DNA-binding transcriptional regulator [Terriglobia bacterium]